MKNILITTILLLSFSLSAQIKVFDNFENGNVELVNTNDSANLLEIIPALKTDLNTTRCWFNFGVTGFDTTKDLSVYIRYTNLIIAPQYPVFSYDKLNWKRVKTTQTKTKSVTFSAKFNSDTVYFATGYPYIYTQLISYVDSIASNKFVDTLTLEISEGGLKIPMIVIRDTNSKPTDMVWITGRQHAFETTLNYSMEGFVNYLISDAKKARKLRKNTVIYIVPMVDVDNVFIGASGRMQKPVDFNRDWSTKPYWKAIKRIQELMAETIKKYNYRIYLDFHSTYPGASYPVYGIFNEYSQNQPEFHNIKHFFSIFKKNAGYSLDEINGNMDKFYADAYSAGLRDSLIKVTEFSSTVECDWNNNYNGKPLDKSELRVVGALIAETLCDYLK